MAFASDSTTAPARPLLPLDRRAIGRDGWARAREIAARLGGEISDHVAEGMRQAWAAARGLLQAGVVPSEETSATAPNSGDTPDAVRADLDALIAEATLLPVPAPLPSLTAALSRRRAIFGAVAVEADLTPAQEALQTSRRKELYEILHPETAHGAVGRGGKSRQIGDSFEDRFTSDTAERTGRSERAVQRDAAQARTLHLRRQLEAAAEHGADLLAALGLPRLVHPDLVGVDLMAAGDALDRVITALDALDGDTDLEDEPAEDDGTLEPWLASPERSPEPPPAGYCGRWGAYVDRSSSAAQTNWAQGARHDRELDPCDGPIDEDELDDDGISRGEGDDSDMEPWLASPAGDGDQGHWAQGDSRDHEDATEGDGRPAPDWYARPIGPVRPDVYGSRLDDAMRAVMRQAEAVQRRVKGGSPPRDPDLVTFVGMPPGMVMWGGPVPRTFLRDGVPVAVMTAV